MFVHLKPHWLRYDRFFNELHSPKNVLYMLYIRYMRSGSVRSMNGVISINTCNQVETRLCA